MQQFIQKAQLGATLPEDIARIDAPRKLLELLYERGWNTGDKIQQFLHPDKSYMHDPYLMQDMEKAVMIIRDALAKQEHITIFGDYDVDGVTATSILITWLKKQRAAVDYYIPDRHGEGYGLNSMAVTEIAKRSSLLITVDCGITSINEVALAKSLGMRVIVTDHHQLGDELPQADAVLDPLLGDYPFRYLCGAGVAFKLLQALGGDEAISGLWDLAALATVADIVPLVDENRIIVAYGLKCMAENKRPGLHALMEIANVQSAPVSTDIAYKLAPRINAGGRLALASQSVELLTTRNEEKARAIAERLNSYNDKRKELELQIYNEAMEYVRTKVNFLRDKIIIVCGRNWELGVIGLVASRMTEKFHWPTIVFSVGEDGRAIGSARSIPGINIHEVLSNSQSLFERFGGHSQAAGLTLQKSNIPLFLEQGNQYIESHYDPKAYIPTKEYDLQLDQNELTEEFVQAFDVIQPIGFGNPAPVFYLAAQQISDVRPLGKELTHLRLMIGDDRSKHLGIWYRQGHMVDQIPETADIVTSIYVNVWHEIRSIQCEVSALNPTFPQKHFQKLCLQKQDSIDILLVRYFSNPQKPASTVSARCIDIETLISELTPVLQREIQGTLFVLHTPDSMRLNTVTLVRLAVGNSLDYSFFTTDDLRGFNTVLIGPDWEQLSVQYRRVVLLDGVFYEKELEDIRRKLPSAEITVIDHPKTGNKQWFERVCSNEEQLRALYKLFKKEYIHAPTLESLSVLASRSVGAVYAAMIGFAQLGLLTLKADPFGYDMAPVKKVELSESPLFRRFLKAVQNASV